MPQIRTDINKMVHICVKNGGYNANYLRGLYICDFYDIYRFVEQEIKAKA